MDKKTSDALFIALGIAGAFIGLWGYFQSTPYKFYVVGSTLLLFTALHYKLLYFIALECILLACHGSIMLNIGFYTQIALPILLCFQLLIFYIMLGKQNSVLLIIGIVGIAMLSLGFASNNQWMFFSGSTCIALYAYYCIYKGIYPAYIWAAVNSIFALLTFAGLCSPAFLYAGITGNS